jgi:hypothetical protein
VSLEVEDVLGGSLWSIGCGGKASLMGGGVTSSEEHRRLIVIALIVMYSVGGFSPPGVAD